VTGAATVGTILVGLVRVKVFALLVGPAGIGVYGILSTVIAWASAVIGVGIGSSSVREIAASVHDSSKSEAVRSSVWAMTVVLGLACFVLMAALRHTFSPPLNLGNEGPELLGWAAIAAALTIVSGTQMAELQAFGHISDLAKLRVVGAIGGTIAALALTAKFHLEGLAIGLAAIAGANVVIGFWFQSRLPTLRLRFPGMPILVRNWYALASLGLMMVISAFAGYLAQLILRAQIAQHDGLNAAGLYQAAWGLSVTNLGIILAAVVADYYPRLAQSEHSRVDTERLVNQQLEILLLIGGPLLCTALALAPLMMHILYSRAFLGGTELLRWHLLGDVFKLPGWCLGYVLVARRDGRVFMLAESGMAALNVGLYFLLRDRFGLNAAGIAYFLAVAAYSAAMMLVCRGRCQLRITAGNLRLLAIWAILLGILLMLASLANALLTGAAGIAIALVATIISFRRLHRTAGTPSLDPRNVIRALRQP
jgi:PST family polysaccharide transporter